MLVADVAGQAPPQVPSISQRPNGSSLGTIRGGAADEKIWFGWRVGVPSTAIAGLTFSAALARADALSVTSVEAASTQITADEVPKPLDPRLQTGERNAVVYRLRELNQQVLAYRADDLGPDVASRRRVFALAKAINAPLIVTQPGTPGVSDLAQLDTLAEELGVSVAIESRSNPQALVDSLQGRSQRLGVAADLGGWMREGLLPTDGLRAVKDRLLLVRVSDRSALGAKGRPVVARQGRRRARRVLPRRLPGRAQAALDRRRVRGDVRGGPAGQPDRLRARHVAGHGGARASAWSRPSRAESGAAIASARKTGRRSRRRCRARPSSRRASRASCS